MFRTLTPRRLAFDIVAAALCLLLRLAIGVNEVPMFFVVIAMAAALGLRRVSPAIALAVAWIGAIVQVAAGLDPDVSNLAILPVLYATASYGVPQLKWLGLVSGGVGAAIIAVYMILRDTWDSSQCGTSVLCFDAGRDPRWPFLLLVTFLFALVVFVLSWTFGLLAKTWRKARESTMARVIAERQRIDAQQDVVVEQERNRIARDMHDVVAHSLAVVIAQADGARYAREQDPRAVDTALATIAGTAREALGDVRILLGQLRHSQGESPQPALADLERLFDQLRSSGLRIVFEQRGELVVLPAGQQLAIYRIVQEGLTNALRHGEVDDDVTVSFEWTVDTVTVSMRNGIPADVEEGVVTGVDGHGLAGMRERAVLWGGTFAAGPAAGNAYLVTAALPIRPHAEAAG